MNQEIKKLWVNALRSGNYRQGKYMLHNISENAYCCLGVLCDIALKNIQIKTVIVESKKSPDKYMVFGDNQNKQFLPQEIVLWAGIKDNPEMLITDAYFDRLVAITDLNDYTEYNFSQLADLIEAQL